ncbi:MAG: cytochrome c-550 PedF [Rhodobacteraceae bacterium]|nr:cytochrome c-550 PedF [Paracoccaceae bacterium]
MTLTRRIAFSAAALLASASLLHAHGDVAPQPINTDALPDVGEEWLTENPYRAETAGEEVWAKAIEIGSSGFNQNCARCHGLQAISGGLAPDLRYLEAEEFGDEWFVERFQVGYTQNGITKMPAFGELLGQKAAWAIRTYIETRPDDQAVTDVSGELKDIRDALMAAADGSATIDTAATSARLMELANNIETLSGAPVADSIALQAANALNAGDLDLPHVAEILTIGLSAAH